MQDIFLFFLYKRLKPRTKKLINPWGTLMQAVIPVSSTASFWDAVKAACGSLEDFEKRVSFYPYVGIWVEIRPGQWVAPVSLTVAEPEDNNGRTCVQSVRPFFYIDYRLKRAMSRGREFDFADVFIDVGDGRFRALIIEDGYQGYLDENMAYVSASFLPFMASRFLRVLYQGNEHLMALAMMSSERHGQVDPCRRRPRDKMFWIDPDCQEVTRYGDPDIVLLD